MPANCSTVKNPCKICLESVNTKTGVQCQGACKTWVHYNCLDYTPGKIRDIKQGIIKVMCPCADCKSPCPKERRTDEPLSCTNTQCPSNLPRTCTSISCPKNKDESSKKKTLQLCEKTACKANRVRGGTAEKNMQSNTNLYQCAVSSSQSEMFERPKVTRQEDPHETDQSMIDILESVCHAVKQVHIRMRQLMYKTAIKKKV